MASPDLFATAAEMGRAIDAGTLHPVDLTEAMLAAIDAHPDAPRIYARTTPARARAEAEAAAVRVRAGTRRGLLDGVPISWKDLYDSAGVATESGSRLLEGRVPKHDARVLANATRAGLVCLGKTHQTELAFSGLGINTRTATPPNVNDPACAPGGSSSGAAASVAFGLAAAGIGSDTGGSVRAPAAWNGLVGLKTSLGDLPADGTVPLCPKFDTFGPLTRSVEDAALVHAAMGGRPVPDLAGASLSERRFLVLDTPSLPVTDAGPQVAFEDGLSRLSAAGAMLSHASMTCVDEAMGLASLLFTTEAYATWRDAIEAAPDRMDARVLGRFRIGKDHGGADYVAGWQRLDVLRRDYLALTAGYDGVLIPSVTVLPPRVDDLLADDALFAQKNLLTLRNTRVASLMGLSALTLPLGVASCGMMIMAPAGAEVQLLCTGATMEGVLSRGLGG